MNRLSSVASLPKGRLPATVKAANLSDQVGDAIVDALADGILKPNQRLIEAEIAADLGVSRLPVREAFKTLATRGIVELNLYRGARVAEIGADRVALIRSVRTVIEQAAFAKAARSLGADPGPLARLDQIIESMKRGEEKSDLSTLNRLDIQFHRTIVVAAQDPFLLALWEALALHLRIVFAWEVSELPRPIPYASVHLAIRYALAEGDAGALEDLIADHIAGRSNIDPTGGWKAGRSNRPKQRRRK
jgi:DNA-binding GntR family transcriptional regulator